MGQDKRQKTDRRDSAELADSLDRYLRSKDKRALSPVAVPTVQQEQDRALVRYHRQLMADRNRCEGRGKPWAMIYNRFAVPDRSSNRSKIRRA